MKNPLVLSLLSALLLSVGWLEFSGLPMLFAFIPLLLISDRYDGSRKGWWKTAGWVALALGLWSATTTWWIYYAATIGAILSVLITIVLFGGIFMIYHSVSKKAPRVLAFTILICGWIAAEYIYTVGDLSFPWLMLGNGLANDVRAIQWYSITGIFGGSFWILITNVLLYSFIVKRGVGRFVWAICFLVVPIVVSLIQYYSFDDKGQQVKVSVIQPNIDPYNTKFDSSQEYQDSIIFALAAQAPHDVDIIVAPETAVDMIYENDFRTERQLSVYRNFLKQNYPGAHMVFGAMTYKFYNTGEAISKTARISDMGTYWYDVYNGAVVIDTASQFGIHHKSKLTPGVEKMPFYSITRHLESLIVDLGGTSGQLGYDTVRTVFTTRQGTTFATGICYESIYGAYFTEFVRNGAQFITIITNDGWWGNSPGYRQHFSFSRLRAIETRRDIARSANTGISGFINSRGDVLQKTEWWVSAQVTHDVNVSDRITFYVRYGDFLARICCYVFGLGILYYIAYRFRKKDHLVE